MPPRPRETGTETLNPPPPTALAQLLGRLTPEELHGVISAANETLKSHGSHSFLALLLPLLVVDLCSVGLIAALNPWLLLAPWDFPLADVALPISIEFVLFFCMFPGQPRARARRSARRPKRPDNAAPLPAPNSDVSCSARAQ